MQSSSNVELVELGGLFEHSARPAWGLATCVGSSNTHASFQFQDGKLRRIGQAFIHLLKEVDRPIDVSERIQNELAAKAGLTISRQKARAAGDTLYTVSQQVRLFRADFPEGFADAAYVTKHRGAPDKRAAKRHRDPAIARANALIGRSELLTLIAAGDFDTVVARLADLLGSTSLLNKQQLEPLGALYGEAKGDVAAALCDLLDDEVDFTAAMDVWIAALSRGGKVSWQLATAPLALLLPSEHLCVSPTILAQQARWLAPRLEVKREPSGQVYKRLLALTRRLTSELEKLELTPRDLLDVHDFMWLTLRPAARKRIDAMPVKDDPNGPSAASPPQEAA